MTISELPTPPSRNDSESVFVDRANSFLGALPTFRTEANALGDAVEADKIAAAASATAALGHANTASGFADAASGFADNASGFADDAEGFVGLAQAAANFKGLWSALTGALSKPATVFHSDKYWALNTDLADVTAKEPGVDVEWLELASGGLNIGDVIETFADLAAPEFLPAATSIYLKSTYPALGALVPVSAPDQKLTDPAALPAFTGNDAAFSPDGTYLAVAHAETPFITIYKRSGDVFTKLDDPADLPAFTGNGAAFSPDGTYLAVAHSTTPFITIYRGEEDTATEFKLIFQPRNDGTNRYVKAT